MSVTINGSGIITGLDADGISAQPVFPGQVLQVVSTTKTDTFTATVTGFVDITGLSATITPLSASNKILVFCTTNIGVSNASYFTGARILRDSTPVFVGDTAGSRASIFGGGINDQTNSANNINCIFIDSPATTNATTYKVQAYCESSAVTVCINRSGQDSDNAYNGRYASSITLVEIAA
jgi:hypothetical protein